MSLSKKDKDIILNILEAIEKIGDYSISINSAEQLFADSKSFDAILMNLIIIGEMSIKISEEFKKKNDHIRWKEIKGLRNIVVHDYFGVDVEEIWQIINNDILNLKNELNKILKNEGIL